MRSFIKDCIYVHTIIDNFIVSERILITVIITIMSHPEYTERPDVHRSIDYIATETGSEKAQLTRIFCVIMEVS